MFKIEKINDATMHTGLTIDTYAGALHDLTANGFTPVSVADLAMQRTHLGAYHEIAWTGSRTTDFFLHKNGRYYLAHANPTTPTGMATLDAIQDFNANHSELPHIKGLLGRAIEIGLDDLAIPVTDLATHPVSRFLLGNQVHTYATWLTAAAIPLLPITLPPYALAKNQDPFIRPLIMRCTDNWSGIITANADTHTLYGFRGTSHTWTGPTTPNETFPRAHLDAVHKLVPLADRDHTLPELERILTAAGYTGLINGLLRYARNGGQHGLPANYGTFTG